MKYDAGATSTAEAPVNRNSPGVEASPGIHRPTRFQLRAAIAAAIVLLALVNVLDHNIRGLAIWVAIPGTAALIGLARAVGLRWSDLGLGRDRLRVGTLYAVAAIALVAVVYALALSIPATRRGFLDTRYHGDTASALETAFGRVPLGTILFEEVAFRGVLWALFSRLTSPRSTLLATSALFGLWHVLPSLHLASANAGVRGAVGGTSAGATALAVLGAVGVTAAGGIVFGELRRRSGSLVASAGAHWATNGLGVVFGLLAWQLR